MSKEETTEAVPVTIVREMKEFPGRQGGMRQVPTINVQISPEWLGKVQQGALLSFVVPESYQFQMKQSPEWITKAKVDGKGRKVLMSKFINVVRFVPRGDQGAVAD